MEKFLESEKLILGIVKKDPTAMKDPMAFVRRAVKDVAISQLNRAIAACSACSGYSSAKTISYGSPNASVMVIMDYPEETQMNFGKPTGPFGTDPTLKGFLERCFTNLGVDMEQIFFMNAVNCCPTYKTGNSDIFRAPKKDECKACYTFIKKAVDIVHPLMIIIMGNVALNAFKRDVISKCHGKFFELSCIPAMPTYSPTYLKSLKGQINETERVMKFKEFKKDIENAILFYKRQWPNSVLFKREENN